MIRRQCKLPEKQSFFLFGPRLCGKTTLIREYLAARQGAWEVNLLDSSTSIRYLKSPELFRLETLDRLKSKTDPVTTVFIDEIQKIPSLLDEVQLLMDSTDLRFILTGSSARKLKRGSANLLGGRAVERHLFPFLSSELRELFSLEKVLKFGSLPKVLLAESDTDRLDLLSGYIATYLREEIQQEAAVRNISGFVSFLEVAAQTSGAVLNFSNIARDVGLHARTVQNYYQILEDTLIGLRLPGYARSSRRQLRSAPKFYLFDIGVINALERQLRSEPDVIRYGKLFEHFIVLETHRTLCYESSDGRLFYWHTKEDLEVDLLIENRGQIVAAVEIKSSERVTESYLKGLLAFQEEHPQVPCYVVARVPEPFQIGPVRVLPWKTYLQEMPMWIS